MDKIAIIIPAYNEAEVIVSTLRDIRKLCNKNKLGKVDLIVVDDGSSDGSGKLALPHCDYLLTHRRNCGLGASLATGIEYARRKGYDYLITFDSDGQHDPRDIRKALTKMRSDYDIVIGSRFIGTYTDMPRGRRSLLFLSNIITYLFFGVWTTDSQSGFRGLSRRALDSIRIKSNRMEVSSEFFGEIKRIGLRFAEIPIHIRYTKYSLRKGQTNAHGAGVLVKLLYNIFR
jgi:glycosyltransferase involved in cell wall biosynthesis